MSNAAFALTDKHLKLLRHAYVDFGGYETGAPTIDGKRPYGNSDVADDVIAILFGDLPTEAREALYDYAMQLHRETATALQIVLCTGSFTPGTYQRTEGWKARSWALVESKS